MPFHFACIRPLWRLELPAIDDIPTLLFSKADLAKSIGVPEDLLLARAFQTNQHFLYTSFITKKRNGEPRTLHAPYWPLKNMQSRIKTLLEDMYRPSPRVMGFVKGRGIRSNAAMHLGKRLILNIDLQDFFPSIHIGRVRGRLRSRPYSLTDDVATTIARLCTLDGVLPIGAPSSPILANIVASSLDGELTRIAREGGCFYTRYADDITFSTNRRSFPPTLVSRSSSRSAEIELGEVLVSAITNNGFLVNPAKTRILSKADRQEVCGVVCNERLNPRRSLLREVRGALHAWRKYGLEAAELTWKLKYNWREAHTLERSLRGRIEHIIHIKGQNDPSVALIVERFNGLYPRQMRNIDYVFNGDRKETIRDSICLIEGASERDLEWGQGSGFVGPDGAIITNYHVIAKGRNVFDKIEVTFPSKGVIKYEMAVTFSDYDRDIAILRPKDRAWTEYFKTLACELSFAEVGVGDKVWIGGFPNYFIGDSCTVFSGEVVGTSVDDGQKLFRVSQMIVKGNSGGPAFDSRGQVIGIATKGVDTHDIPNIAYNGCIALHTIDRALFNS